MPEEDLGDEQTGSVESPERWSDRDAPTLFSANLERVAAALPDQGEVNPIPWTGSYWPTSADSINYRWDGSASQSPAKKYEVAFGGTNVENRVSRYHGIDSRASSAKSCTESSECNDSLGEICAKREGRSAGLCVPTWFGLCHAWAPAAIMLPEPQHEVVKNGVTFKVQDIKALATIVHDRTTTKFISLRCNANDRAGEITYDEHGRADAACRDTNAGTYHIILANYLGIQNKSFVEDRTFDSEVWNQPMRGYKVLEKRAVTAQEANRLIGVKGTAGAATESSATLAAQAWQDLQEVTVKAGDTYTVTMTGSGGDADLFVQFGAKATSSSYACKSDGSSANETCTGTVPAGATTMFVGVYGYSGTSTVSVKSTTSSVASAYAFNPDAVSFLYVKNAVSYISEIRSEQDGNMSSNIDRYTGRDTYEYILELDASGAIIGGEWVGDSKKNHPDFLWLPTGVGSRSVAGGAIRYSDVKELVDASVK